MIKFDLSGSSSSPRANINLDKIINANVDRPHLAQAVESEKELDQTDNGDADDSVITKQI